MQTYFTRKALLFHSRFGEGIVIIGVLVIFIAVFANVLGIDNNSDWGTGRTFLLKAGIGLITIGILFQIFQKNIQDVQLCLYTAKTAFGRDASRKFVFISTIIFTTIGYIWFAQPNVRNAEGSYNYYGELAKSFRHGDLFLTEIPSPMLLELKNPYDYNLRKQEGIEDFPWDVSLYKGKFYIYWGPVPALFILPFSDKSVSNIEDYHIALVFALGLFIYTALMLFDFWKGLSRTPIRILAIVLLVSGFSIPIPIMLKTANVYEAAIFACQFFFVGGCYWSYSSFKDKSTQNWKLALAGIHWGLAAGSRFTILPTVGFTTLILLWALYFENRHNNWGKYFPQFIALGTPLFIASIMLSWYNWARFDSIFEFGIRYQLTNVDYTQFSSSFSPRFFFINLKVYFIHSVNIQARFPYLSLVEYANSNTRTAGLFFVSPFLFMLFSPLIRRLFIANDIVKPTYLKNTITLFAGASTISAVIIFTFYFIALRYTLDFLPSTMILIALFLGYEFEVLSNRGVIARVLALVLSLFALINLTASTLLAIPPSSTTFMLNFLNSLSKLLGIR